MADTESDILSESVLLEEIRARYTAARDHARDWRTEARDTFNMYSGNQWSEDDKNKLIELDERWRLIVELYWTLYAEENNRDHGQEAE